MLRIAVKNNTDTTFDANTWVGVEITPTEWHFLEANPPVDYTRYYFLDSDKTTPLVFFRVAFNPDLKYALFMVEIPSTIAPRSVRYIYLATDATEDRATIGQGSPSYADVYVDTLHFGLTKPIVGSYSRSSGAEVQIDMYRTPRANDVYIGHVWLSSSSTWQRLVRTADIATNVFQGIVVDSSRRFGMRYDSGKAAKWSNAYLSWYREYTLLSGPGYFFVDDAKYTLSYNTPTSFPSSTLVYISHSGGDFWRGAIYRVAYFNNKAFPDPYYFALRRFWKRQLYGQVWPEKAFRTKRIVLVWDQSGVGVYNPETGQYQTLQLTPTSYDGTRTITIRPLEQTAVKEAKEYSQILPEDIAKAHAFKLDVET